MKVIETATRTFWKGELKIEGLIEEQDQRYNSEIYIKGSQVIDYSCSCINGNSFRGMCEHCRLLFEQYLKNEKHETGKSISTSQEVRTMIREYTNREVAGIVSSQEDAGVSFIPTLYLGRDTFKLDFKIGRERLYVLKDLVAFTKAVKNGTYVEYGKNLAFHHNIAAFTEESRALVIFVTELVSIYLDHYKQMHKSSFVTLPVIRDINVSKANRDDFFDIMVNQVINVSDYHGQSRRMMLKRENPQLEVTAEKTGRDGLKISISKDIMCFSGERHFYVSDNNKFYQLDEECSSVMSVFLEQLTNIYGASGETFVNDKDIPLLYERVLKKIEQYCIIKEKNIVLENYRPDELKARFEFDSAGMNQIAMRPVLSYGEFSFMPLEDEKVPRTICRDVPGEFRINQVIAGYFKYNHGDNRELLIIDDDDAAYSLLTEGIPEFMALGEVYFSETFKKLKVRPAKKISISAAASGNWLEITVDTGDMSGSDLKRILSQYSKRQKFYRMKNGDFIQLEEEGILSIAELIDSLAISKSELEQKKIRLPKYRAFYLNSVLKDNEAIAFYRDTLFKSVIRGMKSVEDSDFEIPKTLKNVLRTYQKTGFRWLRTLDEYGFGGILADDMGLGKTIQVIAVILSEAEKNENRQSLIVCPASLVYNWESEINIFAPSLKVNVITGSAQERENKIINSGKYDVLITSYDLLKRDIELYEEKKFRFQVIDEAQFIKNASTQSARAVKAVKADTKFALTGTPIENRLSELWSIFDYLMPGFLFGYQKFKKEYETPIIKENDVNALQRLKRFIGPFILRRLKTDVLKELPDKLETIVYSRFDEKQKELYTANAYELKQKLEREGTAAQGDKFQILAELTKLRQICCDPSLCYDNYKGGSAKLETCMDLILNGISGGHKILLFSQFTTMLDIISKRLDKEGIEYYMLTGSTQKENRIKLVNEFHKGASAVFLISLKAGGTGLNLTAADIVIHYDPWWNIAAQNQATDRAYRIGQEKQVSVFKLITKETIEENIIKLQESKKNLSEQIISEGTISLSTLTREDIMDIL